MIFRFARAYSRFETENFTGELNSSSSDIALLNLKDNSNYTTEKIVKVIKSYYTLYTENRNQEIKKNWGRNPIVIKSLKNIIPLIKSMQCKDVLKFIYSLSLLQIQDYKVWDELENNFIKSSHKALDSILTPKVVLGFANAGRKNSELWNLIEVKILYETNPDELFNARGVSDIFLAFGHVNIRNIALLDKLKLNSIAVIDSLVSIDVLKIFSANGRLKFIDPEYLEILLKRVCSILPTLSEKIMLSFLEYSITLGGNDKYVKALEEKVCENFELMKIAKICGLANKYGKLEPDKRNESRKKFMDEFERNYCRKRQNLLKDIRQNKTYREIRIFWGLSKYDSCSNKEVWKAFFNDLKSINREDLNLTLKELILELEDYGYSKKLIS